MIKHAMRFIVQQLHAPRILAVYASHDNDKKRSPARIVLDCWMANDAVTIRIKEVKLLYEWLAIVIVGSPIPAYLEFHRLKRKNFPRYDVIVSVVAFVVLWAVLFFFIYDVNRDQP
jgi:hypothetical protein